MFNYYLLLGSNLGNRNEYLEKAKVDLKTHFINIIQKSSIYETEAWGNPEAEKQNPHLNQVIYITCHHRPETLLNIIQAIENNHGRRRFHKWGARTLDIDILYHQDRIISTSRLTIPHPEIPNRRFALVPLVEIAPHLKHPILDLDQTALLNFCSDPLEVKEWSINTH